MSSTLAVAQRRDGRLWVIALGLSLLLNGSFIAFLAFAAIHSEFFAQTPPTVPAAPVVPEEMVMIFPEIVPAAPSVATIPAGKPRFARTSADQAAAPPEKPAFIGERNTRATSDRAPDRSAPAMPSQAGAERDDLETTESDYSDGKTAESAPKPAETSPPTPPAPEMDTASAANPPPGAELEVPGKETTLANAPKRDRLMDGPSPVDIPVPREESNIPDPAKPEPPATPAQGKPETVEVPPAPEPPKPVTRPAPADPAFQGNQRKTAMRGSISRTGKSALDVTDTPLGRYQAIISRAVEQEWQRNCVRHRDFITPGFLTVRFFVEASGRVRTVQFVGTMETGEVQKGFTLNSIRNAGIPPMPPAVKRELGGEALELLFNFYF